jgi:undecaprenyl-diphosphatase
MLTCAARPAVTVEAVAIRRSHVALAVAMLLAFFLLARWAFTGDSMAFDLSIRDAIHTLASPAATRAFALLTMLGSDWVMAPLAAIVVCRLTFAERPRQAAILVCGYLAANLLSRVLKAAFHRPRPEVFFGLPLAENYSFPSGHALVSTVFYGLLAFLLAASYPHRRGAIAAALAIFALMIGFSRVYLGYHYPTDILGGWACAAACLALGGPPIHDAGQSQE